MIDSRKVRATKFPFLLVLLGLGQPLSGCGSDNRPAEDFASAGNGGNANFSTSTGGSIRTAGTGNGDGANPSATVGGISSSGASVGGASTGGDATGGRNIGATAGAGSAGAGNAAGTLAAGGSIANASGGSNATAGATWAGSANHGGNGTAGAGTGGKSTASAGSGAVAGAANSTGGAAGSSALTSLPTALSVLEAMRRANDYFVARWPDPTKDIVTDKTRPSNLWTRAIYYEGLMGLYSIEPDSTKKTSYYEYAVTWASSPTHSWSMTYTAAGTMTNNADNQACGQTYIDLYRIDPQAERIAVIKTNIDDMISKNTVNVWTWIDAIQMSMPVFAKLGNALNDPKYFDAMWSLYAYSRNTQGGGLYNAAEGLWWRDWHFTPSGGTKQVLTSTLNNAIPSAGTDAYIVAPNGKNLYWSRGNGWVMAALVRVLDELPMTDAHRADYLSDFKALAAALLPIQRSDGFWNESLADPSHCATIGIVNQDGPETSGTALFAYGLAWGIRNGHLDAATYGSALVKAWNGLTTVALQSNGLLGYVQSTGDRPCTGPAPLSATTLANFDDYGVGCLLLAGTEVYRLTPN